ncbi:MAG: SPOR domain-containing protein [Armatimonadota bacterium]|nr:SPOR domain-containing protein [Armatimonadota bacterium]
MARNNSAGAFKFAAAAVAAIVVGISVGYLIGGAHSSRNSGVQIAQQPAPLLSAPGSTLPHAKGAARPNGDYTAPGAPRIQIREEKHPQLTRSADETVPAITPPKVTKPDSEASQQGDTVKSNNTVPAANPNGDPNPPAAPNVNGDNGSSSNTAGPLPDNGAASPNGTDFEHVSTHPDAEGSQAGTDDRARYRVQAGAFPEEKNARVLAAALRDRGFSASTRADREGDKTVYRVQIGAYRTRTDAGKAALDLQRNGYPAYVAPISP